MTDAPALAAYRHNPRPVGYPIAFRLDERRLVVDTTRKVDAIELGAIKRIRLTYEPRSLASNAFRTQLSLANGGRASFTSVSWNSLTDVSSQDAEYSAFVRALVAAVARANPDVALVVGKPRPLWLATIAGSCVMLLAVAVFAWRAFAGGAGTAALVGLAVGVLGIWQLEPMIRLNRPGRFTPDRLPDALLPGG